LSTFVAPKEGSLLKTIDQVMVPGMSGVWDLVRVPGRAGGITYRRMGIEALAEARTTRIWAFIDAEELAGAWAHVVEHGGLPETL
jgi:hypothetical protein